MKAITIEIFEASSDPGYHYRIWEKEVDEIWDEKLQEMEDELDGGFCTTNMTNALGMAMDMAQNYITRDPDHKDDHIDNSLRLEMKDLTNLVKDSAYDLSNDEIDTLIEEKIIKLKENICKKENTNT